MAIPKTITLARSSITRTDVESYSVQLTVSVAINIDANVFVLQRITNTDNTFNDKFAAVATSAQLEDLSIVAPNAATTYFRLNSITLTADNPDYLEEIVDSIISDISILLDNEESLDGLTPSATYTITSSGSTFTNP